MHTCQNSRREMILIFYPTSSSSAGASHYLFIYDNTPSPGLWSGVCLGLRIYELINHLHLQLIALLSCCPVSQSVTIRNKIHRE